MKQSNSRNINNESKNGDEEQPYEISLEGQVYDMGSVMEEDELSDLPSPGKVPKPNLQRRLTEVSRKYDRNNKGYLDPTEQALRQMDNKNKGFLDIDKVYVIMQSLQEEQQRSQELIDTIRQEHKKSMSLKRGLIALTVFAVLLAISNIGTSFAAARLAKEMKVSSTSNDLVNMDGEILGTVSKTVELEVNPIPIDERRRLWALATQAQACPPNDDGVHECFVGASINFQEAVRIYRQFCPSYPNGQNICGMGGVSELIVNCNGDKTLIKGGMYMPQDGPGIDTDGFGYMVFPSLDHPYNTYQELEYSSSPWAPPCKVDIQMKIWCFTDGSECILFGNYDTTQCPGLSPNFCGTSSV